MRFFTILLAAASLAAAVPVNENSNGAVAAVNVERAAEPVDYQDIAKRLAEIAEVRRN